MCEGYITPSTNRTSAPSSERYAQPHRKKFLHALRRRNLLAFACTRRKRICKRRCDRIRHKSWWTVQLVRGYFHQIELPSPRREEATRPSRHLGDYTHPRRERNRDRLRATTDKATPREFGPSHTVIYQFLARRGQRQRSASITSLMLARQSFTPVDYRLDSDPGEVAEWLYCSWHRTGTPF